MKFRVRTTRRSAARSVVAALVILSSTALGACSVVGLGRGPDGTHTYRVRGDQTLHDVAHKFGLGFVEVAAANPGVDPWLPGSGTVVVLPTKHLPPRASAEGLVINLADMRLYHYVEEGEPPRSYAIGIGREGLTTPLGPTTIVRKAQNPVWRPTPRMRKEDPALPAEVGPGPDNPMGSRALYLAKRPYAIHGTNKPLAIGRRVSSGCVRMYPDDIEALYEAVDVGTRVTIVNQPVKVGWIEGELYVEAHPTLHETEALQLGREAGGRNAGAQPDGRRRQSDPRERNLLKSKLPDDLAAQVRAAAGKDAARLDWERVREAAFERRGYPVRVTR